MNNLLEAYLNIVLMDFLRYFIPASTAFTLFWVILKKRYKHKFIQEKWPDNYKLWFEFKYSVFTSFVFAAVGMSIFILKQHDVIVIYKDLSSYGLPYAIFCFITLALFHDMYFYFTHRWMHQPKIFKYVHKVHHQSTNPSPWAAYSFHPIEAFVQAAFLPIILLFIPVHQLVVFSFLVFMILRNVLGHLGYEFLPKSFIKNKWINWNTSTVHHNIHHKKFNSNFGLYFTWWDRLFDTVDKDYKQKFNEVSTRKAMLSKIVKHSSLILLILPIKAQAQNPLGKWMTFSESTGNALSVVEIYRNEASNKLEGRIDSIILQSNQGIDPICSKCPKSFKDKRVVGLEFLWGFELDDYEWTNGKILDPSSGKIYSSKLWFAKNGELNVRAYAGPLNMFYRTQRWRQIKGNGIEGLWETIDEEFNMRKSLVQLNIKSGKLTGKIKKLYLLPHEGNFPLCVSCKGDLKNIDIVGLKIMAGFIFKDGKWDNGTILDPSNGKTYSASFWFESRNELKVRGYLGPFFRTQIWKRLSSINIPY